MGILLPASNNTPYVDVGEWGSPTNPDANIGRLYVYDDNGTTRLVFRDSAGVLTIFDSTVWSHFNGFEDRTDSTISFDDATYTLSIDPVAANFEYWVQGVKYVSTGDTEQIDNTKEGVHVIYYDGATLTSVANPTNGEVSAVIRTKAIVCIVYWDTSTVEAIYVGEERHGTVMTPDTHAYLHFTEGLKYISPGLGLNTMSVDGTGVTADAQFGIDVGAVADEDLYLPISAVIYTTGLPIYYMTGALADWNKSTVAGFSVRTFDGTSADRLAYNQYTLGAWQLTEVPSNDFVLYHIFATTEKDYPMISIMGQNVYGNKNAARTGALTEIQSLVLNNILFPEIRPIATIIYQTNLAYANAVNAKIVSTDEGDDYIDWRSESISRVEISTSNHGALTGLSSDDHTQYLLAAGSRALTSNWDAGAFEIRAETLESDVATGTAPLTIASTTLVSNLNADLLDSSEGTAYAFLAGRTGGQTLNGSDIASEDLDLDSTAHATKGYINLLSPVKLNDSIELDSSYSDGTINGTTRLGTTAPAVTFSQTLHVHTDGEYVLADASDITTMPCTALAVDVGAGADKEVLLRGFISNSAWTWTIGELIYTSTTSGGLTQTAPSTTGEYAQVVGYATHANVMYFDPSLVMFRIA